jgi:beta-phosphoglucomutase
MAEAMQYSAVIFDLDGVLLSTDQYHYQAWKHLADRERIYFDEAINERLRGVSRMESLEIILERTVKTYSASEKEAMATLKNSIYRQLLEFLTPQDVFPGVLALLDELDRCGIKKAVGSSSKNAGFILGKTGLNRRFEGAVCDGNNISRSKPDPQVFLLAAGMLGISPTDCLVVEDAEAGIQAAKAAGMMAMGIGSAAGLPQCDLSAADIAAAGRMITKQAELYAQV